MEVFKEREESRQYNKELMVWVGNLGWEGLSGGDSGAILMKDKVGLETHWW